MNIQIKVTDEYPTRYVAFDYPGTLCIQKDQTRHELAVICYPVNNSDLEGLVDGLHVEMHSHASRGIGVDCTATYPDIHRQQANVYLVDFPDVDTALDFMIVWYLYALDCLNSKSITKLVKFNLWLKEEIEPIMSIDLNDQQRAHLLQLYKEKLQQLGDDKFFEQFDTIREECYKSMGIELDKNQPQLSPRWKPSHVKVNSFYVWRIERQTGPDPVTDYEWALDNEGEPLEYSDEQSATDKATELNAQSNAASILGRQGGKSKSEAKSSASRSNGKRGGRPRSNQAALDMEDI